MHLQSEVRISQKVGSHSNIVYMKEFVENKDRCDFFPALVN